MASPRPSLPPPIGGLPHPDQILGAEIKQSIDSQLVGKGFTKVASDKPDIVVDYQILVNQEKQWNATGMRDPLGLGMSTAMATATSSTINMGTLVLNIYDREARGGSHFSVQRLVGFLGCDAMRW
jgi:Domain of unknown function (DUF4136)